MAGPESEAFLVLVPHAGHAEPPMNRLAKSIATTTGGASDAKRIAATVAASISAMGVRPTLADAAA